MGGLCPSLCGAPIVTANGSCHNCCLGLFSTSQAVSGHSQVDDMTVAGVTTGESTTPGASALSPVNNYEIGLELDPVG